MSDNSVDSIIDDSNSLKEEVEQIIDEIEHMNVEQYKVDKIKDKDMHYNGGEDDMKRTIREMLKQG